MAQAMAANNFISTTTYDEVIELDGPTSTTEPNWANVGKRVRFPRQGQGRVSPFKPRDIFPRDSLKPRRRSRNVFLVLFSLLSFVTFTLLVLLLLGFVKPRNMENSKSCQCVSPLAVHVQPDTQKGPEISRTEVNEMVNSLKENMANLKEQLESRYQTIDEHKYDIQKIDDKLVDLKNRTSNITTISFFSEKFGLLQRIMDANLTVISQKFSKLIVNITKLNLFHKTIHENFTKMYVTVRNISADIQKFNQFNDIMATNTSKVSKKINELSMDMTKFVNDTNENILRTRKDSIIKLELFERQMEENLTFVSQNIDEISNDLQKLANNTNQTFKESLKYINKFGLLQRIMDANLTVISQKFSKLIVNITNLNLFHKTIHENFTKMYVTVRNISADIQKFNQFNDIMATNTSKVSKKINELSMDMTKFVNDTNENILRTRKDSIIKLELFERQMEENLTFVSQNIDEISNDLQKLANNTNQTFKESLKYINKVLDPAKFQGPRGYNGTQGSMGQSGPPGPAGPHGPAMSIDFSKCLITSKTSSPKNDPRVRMTESDTKNETMFSVVCESSLKNGVTKLTKPWITPNGFKYTCLCNNVGNHAITCTIKYLLCS